MNVVLCRDQRLEETLLEIARGLRARGFDVGFGPERPRNGEVLTEEECREYFGTADFVMLSNRVPVSENGLVACPKLRAVVFPGIGTESIPLPAANRLGVLVAYCPSDANVTSMAEATVMFVLCLMLRLNETQHALATSTTIGVERHTLKGKTVGLIGFGRIGRAVAERLRPFGCRILVTTSRGGQDAGTPGVTAVALQTLLAESDVVSLHATLNEGSRRLLGPRELALLKPTAFLVNTARGALVDEESLYAALAGGRIAGAALDAYTQEPLPATSPLRALSNVILTPHAIGATRETLAEMQETAIENISRMAAGMPPLHCKNPQAFDRWRARFASRLSI